MTAPIPERVALWTVANHDTYATLHRPDGSAAAARGQVRPDTGAQGGSAARGVEGGRAEERPPLARAIQTGDAAMTPTCAVCRATGVVR